MGNKVLIVFMEKIILNSAEYNIDKSITILDLIKYFHYNLDLLVVEYNGTICTKSDWNIINVKTKDILEIITIVGGG